MSDNNQQQKSLNECNPKWSSPDVNLDQSPPYCGKDSEKEADNLRGINDDSLNFLKDTTMKKTGFGARVDCDPMKRGLIVNDINNPERQVFYRNSKSIRGADEAMKDMFENNI